MHTTTTSMHVYICMLCTQVRSKYALHVDEASMCIPGAGEALRLPRVAGAGAGEAPPRLLGTEETFLDRDTAVGNHARQEKGRDGHISSCWDGPK